ncbi:MAG: hypothetical protein A2017_00625 [Lentisphaerae bacterium GWF2_44_16]|nr:MAG: hypothetical protein A2017_00625 [Lentisphaerae bacterium GWF2_44_16]
MFRRIGEILIVTAFIFAGMNGFSAAETVIPNDYTKNHFSAINEKEKIILAENGKANVEIVTGEKASPVVKFAAKELQKYLNESTGADIKIVSKRSGAIPAIMLGVNKETENIVGKEVAKLPVDGFIIRKPVNMNAVIIAGKDNPSANIEEILKRGAYWEMFFDKATLYGVYDFLERFVGVRFYFPGEIGTVVPKHTVLSVPAMDIKEAPDFPQRRAGLPGEWYEKTDVSTCNPNLQLLRYRMESFHKPCCHGLTRLDLIERFGKNHPEYFSLLLSGKRDNSKSTATPHFGHLCYKNDALKEEIYKDAETYLTGKESALRNIKKWNLMCCQPGYFNIMPQDGLGRTTACRCEKCAKYFEENRMGELVWGFIIDIAKKLKVNGVPGDITAMAYADYKDIPPYDIPGNMQVMLATAGPWVEHIKEKREKDDKYIMDWDKKIAPKKVWLWNYMYKHKKVEFPGIASPTPLAVGHYYKRVAPYITGALLGSATDQFIFYYLNFYMFYKMAWNSSYDVEGIMKEHNEKMFGPATVPMGKFLLRLEDLWLKCLGKVIETPLGPVNVPPTELELWGNIYTDAVFTELNAYCDEAEKLVSGDPDCLKRVKFIRYNFLGRAMEAHKKYLKNRKALDDLVFEVLPANPAQQAGDMKVEDWKNASSVQLTGYRGTDVPVKTTVYSGWDDKNIYFFFDCAEPEIAKASYLKRENDNTILFQDNSIEIFLAPDSKRKDYYQMIINTAGSIADLKVVTDANGVKKISYDWNSGAEVKTAVNEKSWTAFVKIPLASIGVEHVGKNMDIIANFARSRVIKGSSEMKGKQFVWGPYIRNGYGDILNFGTIRLVKNKSESVSLLKNGDFEKLDAKTGFPASWHFSSRDKEEIKLVQLDETSFCSGGKSLKMTVPPEGVKEKYGIYAGQSFPPLNPNTEYLLTFFFKTENITPIEDYRYTPGVCVNINAGGNKWFPKSYYTGTIPWTKQGFQFKTDDKVADTKSSYIRLRIMGASGTVWFDDVRLRKLN